MYLFGRQYEIRKLKNPHCSKNLLWKSKTLNITDDMIYFASLTMLQKLPFSLYTCFCYLFLTSTYLKGMPHVRQENRKSLFKGNYSRIFVSCFSNNYGNHVHSTFLPAWANLMWCLLALSKPTALEEDCLLRFFLMMQSSRNGHTFYSATGFEQQALHTCSRRIWNCSIWEKSNLIPELAQSLNALLYF